MLPKGRFGSLLVWVIVALPTPVIAADEADIVLAEGPGREQVQAACEKSVKKMVTVMGAPLTAANVAVIVAYLDLHYGMQPAAVAKH
jgi:hypothetical protein